MKPVPLIEYFFARQPLRIVKGLASAYIAYPIAEMAEQRRIRPKLSELRRHYVLPVAQRRQIALDRLVDMLHFAGQHVPYYGDLFRAVHFDPDKVRGDPRYLQDLPCLTKDIIREQGDRLLSRPLKECRHHACKTGGSTGRSCVIYYDQDGADYSSAVTLYARECVGHWKFKPELHFACQFPGEVRSRGPSREDFKCFAMNRSNIFFDRIDDAGLEDIWKILLRRKPNLVHAHPSTIYALACYVERVYGERKAFEIFESSGELLQPYMRETIARVLRCWVINRYGLAEFGVIAYQVEGQDGAVKVLESEGWPEHRPTGGSNKGASEFVFTGFRNRLMPLIRYATGDLARVEEQGGEFVLTDVVGRIHDVVPINGIAHPTHHIQDMLDYRVGGVQEFQIDLRTSPPTMRIVLEPHANADDTLARINAYWPGAFAVAFVGHKDLVRVGDRAKFRHVVSA